MTKAEGMPELVAGDVVAAGVIGEEDGVARIEVEVHLLALAPPIAREIRAQRPHAGAQS
jgi:hypothetical protein